MNTGLEFASGKINTVTNNIEAEDLVFNPHPTFSGVALKHLVSGQETENRLSCHLVKIDPNCCLGRHLHPDHLEIHEVIAGSGTFEIDTNTGSYSTGSVGIIPVGMTHKVVAGADGLFILATFSPALW